MSTLESMFVFPAPVSSYTMHSFPNELLWIPLSLADPKRNHSLAAAEPGFKAGDAIPAVILRSPAARFLIIYLHSNGEDIGLAYPFGVGLRMVLEVHVLLVEYPGYGICPGQCSEEALWQVAQAALHFVTDSLQWPAEDVIIMGRSLGAAVAMRLASTHKCHGLILVAPFLSLVEAVSQYVGALAPMLVGDSFCNSQFMSKVKVPTLVIHGLNDRLVSCNHGRQLWELCPNKKKLFVCPEQMSHNTDLLSNADFLVRPMLRFFSLPDYSFVDLDVPPEAFDKRHCPLYHSLVEAVKDDGPLPRPAGDHGCPVSATTTGPHSSTSSIMIRAGGDEDDVDGAVEDDIGDAADNSVGIAVSETSVSAPCQPPPTARLTELASELGLRLPPSRIVSIDRASDDPDDLEIETSDPLPELTEEMLGGLGDFLHGRELMTNSHSSTARNFSKKQVMGPTKDVNFAQVSAKLLGSSLMHVTCKMPEFVPEDHVPEECDPVWAFPAARDSPQVGSKIASSVQKTASKAEIAPAAAAADDSSPNMAMAPAESEEGSTTVPSTGEPSVSRSSEHGEHASEPDLKGVPPGVSRLNLESGITRFLREDEIDV